MAAGNGNRPDTKELKYERKPVSFITTSAGMAATVTAMVVGSLFGVTGTLWGAALGSGISATVGTVYENAARKTHARLRAMREQEIAETQAISLPVRKKITENRNELIHARYQHFLHRDRNPWRTAGVLAGTLAACFGLTMAVLFTIESASGRTLHSLVTGNKQYGTSFGYSTKSPVPHSPSATVTTVPAPSSASPDASPDASPSPFSGSGGVSSAPTGTPSSSPAASPTQSGVTAPAANAAQSSSSTTVP